MTAGQPQQARRRARRRRAPRRAPAALALLAAAALAAALAAAPAAAQVLPMDKQALLEFKAGLTEQGGDLLLSWVPDSDPCDGWTGVRCTCADFFAKPDDPGRAKVRGQLLARASSTAGCCSRRAGPARGATCAAAAAARGGAPLVAAALLRSPGSAPVLICRRCACRRCAPLAGVPAAGHHPRWQPRAAAQLWRPAHHAGLLLLWGQLVRVTKGDGPLGLWERTPRCWGKW